MSENHTNLHGVDNKLVQIDWWVFSVIIVICKIKVIHTSDRIQLSGYDVAPTEKYNTNHTQYDTANSKGPWQIQQVASQHMKLHLHLQVRSQ